MPSVAVKLYSVFFKFMLKHRLQNRTQIPADDANAGSSFGVTSRPDEESTAPSNPSFTDGVATKDIHIDPTTSVSIRIFLPDTSLGSPDSDLRAQAKSRAKASTRLPDSLKESDLRRNSYGAATTDNIAENHRRNSFNHRRNSYGGNEDDLALKPGNGVYRGYSPAGKNCRKLPVMLQFHGGGFVSGSNDSVSNDFFCRRIAKLCDVIVLAVGYRLSPENRYPAAFEDGLKALHWLAKQANLAECSKSLWNRRGGADTKKSDSHGHIADAFGASMAEPWLASHADPSRLGIARLSIQSRCND